MLIYHGSTLPIEKPDIKHSRIMVDFGKGFYCTKLKDQAEKWAIRQSVRLNSFSDVDWAPIVSVYEFDDSKIESLKAIFFDGYTADWLEFVVKNRTTNKTQDSEEPKYDLVFGNIADDEVSRTVDEYIELKKKGKVSNIDIEFFLRQIAFSQPNDQFCFASDNALTFIKFHSWYEVGNQNE